MYTCIATLKTSNGEYYRTGEEISDFKYRNLLPHERNSFRLKHDEVYKNKSFDDAPYAAPSMPDYVYPSCDSPSFDSGSSSDNSSSDMGGGGSFGGGGSSDSW